MARIAAIWLLICGVGICVESGHDYLKNAGAAEAVAYLNEFSNCEDSSGTHFRTIHTADVCRGSITPCSLWSPVAVLASLNTTRASSPASEDWDGTLVPPSLLLGDLSAMGAARNDSKVSPCSNGASQGVGQWSVLPLMLPAVPPTCSDADCLPTLWRSLLVQPAYPPAQGGAAAGSGVVATMAVVVDPFLRAVSLVDVDTAAVARVVGGSYPSATSLALTAGTSAKLVVHGVLAYSPHFDCSYRPAEVPSCTPPRFRDVGPAPLAMYVYVHAQHYEVANGRLKPTAQYTMVSLNFTCVSTHTAAVTGLPYPLVSCTQWQLSERQFPLLDYQFGGNFLDDFRTFQFDADARWRAGLLLHPMALYTVLMPCPTCDPRPMLLQKVNNGSSYYLTPLSQGKYGGLLGLVPNTANFTDISDTHVSFLVQIWSVGLDPSRPLHQIATTWIVGLVNPHSSAMRVDAVTEIIDFPFIEIQQGSQSAMEFAPLAQIVYDPIALRQYFLGTSGQIVSVSSIFVANGQLWPKASYQLVMDKARPSVLLTVTDLAAQWVVSTATPGGLVQPQTKEFQAFLFLRNPLMPTWTSGCYSEYSTVRCSPPALWSLVALAGCESGHSAEKGTCVPTPAGYFVLSSGNVEPCPAGTFSLAGGDSQKACFACAPGRYNADMGQAQCNLCPPDHVCPVGSVAPIPAAMFDVSRGSFHGTFNSVQFGPSTHSSSVQTYIISLAVVSVVLVLVFVLVVGTARTTQLEGMDAAMRMGDFVFDVKHSVPLGAPLRRVKTALGSMCTILLGLVLAMVIIALTNNFVQSNSFRLQRMLSSTTPPPPPVPQDVELAFARRGVAQTEVVLHVYASNTCGMREEVSNQLHIIAQDLGLPLQYVIDTYSCQLNNINLEVTVGGANRSTTSTSCLCDDSGVLHIVWKCSACRLGARNEVSFKFVDSTTFITFVHGTVTLSSSGGHLPNGIEIHSWQSSVSVGLQPGFVNQRFFSADNGASFPPAYQQTPGSVMKGDLAIDLGSRNVVNFDAARPNSVAAGIAMEFVDATTSLPGAEVDFGAPGQTSLTVRLSSPRYTFYSIVQYKQTLAQFLGALLGTAAGVLGVMGLAMQGTERVIGQRQALSLLSLQQRVWELCCCGSASKGTDALEPLEVDDVWTTPSFSSDSAGGHYTMMEDRVS